VSGAGAGGREALQSRKMQVGTGIEQIIIKLFSCDHFSAFQCVFKISNRFCRFCDTHNEFFKKNFFYKYQINFSIYW
jgi:hypothetical protein